MSQKITKTAIVTGASSGIGLAIAKSLARKGYFVVANSRKLSASKAIVDSPTWAVVDGDVADRQTGIRLAQEAVQRTGRLDLLVNNAGIFVPGNFHEYSEEQYRGVLATNMDGFFYTTQPAVQQMLHQGFGHVVSISTTLASQPVAGVNAFGTYFTKGGINTVTRSLAIEYAQAGIRFNAIGAGIFDTPMHKPENHGFLKELHPIGRLGRPEEIVDAVHFLESATFVTGEILHIDGGAHAGKW